MSSHKTASRTEPLLSTARTRWTREPLSKQNLEQFHRLGQLSHFGIHLLLRLENVWKMHHALFCSQILESGHSDIRSVLTYKTELCNCMIFFTFCKLLNETLHHVLQCDLYTCQPIRLHQLSFHWHQVTSERPLQIELLIFYLS